MVEETPHKVTLRFELHLRRKARGSLAAVRKTDQPSSSPRQCRGIVRIGGHVSQDDGDSGLQQEGRAEPYRTEELPLPIPGIAARAGEGIMAIGPQEMHPDTRVLLPVETPVGLQADGIRLRGRSAHQQPWETARRGSCLCSITLCLVVVNRFQLLLELILILVIVTWLQPVLALLHDFDHREMLRATFPALHQFVHGTPTGLAVLSAFQKNRAKGPVRDVEGGLLASWAGRVRTGPEPIEGAVEEVATQRQERLVVVVHGLGTQIQQLQGGLARLFTGFTPGHARQFREWAGLLD